MPTFEFDMPDGTKKRADGVTPWRQLWDAAQPEA